VHGDAGANPQLIRHGSAASARCAATEAPSASVADSKAANAPSPVVFTRWPAVVLEHLPEQGIVARQRGLHRRALLFPQAGAALDVREQERDRATRQCGAGGWA